MQSYVRSGIYGLGMAVALLFLNGCHSLPAERVDIEKTSLVMPAKDEIAKTPLASQARQLSQSQPNESGFFALKDGVEAMASRVAIIDAAQATLDVQYYIWHDDLVGRTIAGKLLEAADRGVMVRILLDDLDTADKDHLWQGIDQHPNIEVRLFNPFVYRDARWWDFMRSSKRLNHRMHNKSVTADRSVSILGGRNIGDEYFDASEEIGFKDMDVLAVGAIASEVTQAFSLYWDNSNVYTISQITPELAEQSLLAPLRERLDEAAKSIYSSPYANVVASSKLLQYKSLDTVPFHWGPWFLAYDQPSKVTSRDVDPLTHLAPKLANAVKDASEDLIIVSPYFVPGQTLTDQLVSMVDRGVRLRILTNSLAANDVAMVHAGYRRYREDLIRGGVELYEFKPRHEITGTEPKDKKTRIGSSNASLHAKYFGIDKKALFVGSFNLDRRSIEINTEMGVYFEDPVYAQILSTKFDELSPQLSYRVLLNEDGDLRWHTVEGGETVVYEHEPETSSWQRFKNKMMSFIVPEKQL